MARQASKKVAIISCEPNSQKPVFRGKRVHIRKIMSERLRGVGLEPIIYRPMDDISDFPQSGDHAAVVVGGSKLNVLDKDLKRYEWMRRLQAYLQETNGDVPLVGICYGHQALGRAFEARVERYGSDIFYVVGFVRLELTEEGRKDPLFEGIPARFRSPSSHFCYVADTPEGGKVLVRSGIPGDQSVESYRIGETTWGMQFHPEYSLDTIRGFLDDRRERLEGRIDVEGALATLETSQRQDLRILENFARLVSSRIHGVSIRSSQGQE